MVHQGRSPGMEHGEKSDLCPQVFGIGGDGSRRVSFGPEENAVDHDLVLLRDGGNLFRNREDDVEIAAVEQLSLAVTDPLRTSERSTLWAVVVHTRVVRVALVPTFIAAFEMAAESRGPAQPDGDHDAPLRRRHRRVMLLTIGFAVAAEHIRHFQPRTFHGPAA